MPARRVLITGGAGFIGANLAVALARLNRDDHIMAVDNLYRRGSELNLARLREAGVAFHHADVRVLHDLLRLGEVDVIVECSAEPSVMAGVDGGSPEFLVHTNLLGAYHCLEVARRWDAQFVFLSTSRVYPVAALERIGLEERETRFVISELQDLTGVSPAGIAEEFPLEGSRTLYGATKLAAELLIREYADAYGLRTVIDRCGVVAGPWQMGKVDQGVFTYWMLAHVLGWPLKYIGFGGTGKQVRDLLHVEDLVELIAEQLSEPDRWAGTVANVGGGTEVSLSLREATALCAEISGRTVEVAASSEERSGDIPVYLSDCGRLAGLTRWRPQRDARRILQDTFDWIVEHEQAVRAAL